MRRCCKDSLNLELSWLHGPFVMGLEIPCRWCSDFWIWNSERWAHSSEFEAAERLSRSASPKLTEARAERAKEILK